MANSLKLYGNDQSLLAAKVGIKDKTPRSLVERMPSPLIAAKVGGQPTGYIPTRRVVRRSARA